MLATAEAVQTNVTRRLNGGITKLEGDEGRDEFKGTKPGERRPRRGRPPDKTGHKFGQTRDGAPLGVGATKPGSYRGDAA
jgi:hypothetical protein